MSNKLLKSSIIFILLSASCATTPKPVAKEPKKTVTAKTQKDAKSSQAQITAQMNSSRTTADDVASWVIRMSSGANTFTMKDRQYVQTLPHSPKNGSLGEAALVVGILRDIATPPGGTIAFKDIDAQATVTGTTDSTGVLPKPISSIDESQSLERRCREKGLDLALALSGNPLLKNASVFTWAWNAAILDLNSEPFKQSIASVVKAEAILWQEIAAKSGVSTPAVSSPPPPPPAPPAPIQNDPSPMPSTPDGGVSAVAPTPGAPPVPPVPVAPPLSANVPPVPANVPPSSGSTLSALQLSDATAALGRAQDAAAQENYAKAVEEANKVPEGAPNYAMAQENIRAWSNRAVTDLRKKAAFEYRSSTSVTDAKAKKAFLTKSKSYLEEALKKFPNASNLETVQENLRMINSELAN